MAKSLGGQAVLEYKNGPETLRQQRPALTSRTLEVRMDDEAVTIENEEWRPVPQGAGLYEVSCRGRVRALARMRTVEHPSNGTYEYAISSRIMKPYPRNGYPSVTLADRKKYYIHRLVCEAFHGSPPTNADAAHIDGTRTNNSPENLRWASRLENMRDKIAHGTAAQRGKHPGAKLSESDIPVIVDRLRQGEAQSTIAQDYGITQSVVSRIKTRHGKIAA